MTFPRLPLSIARLLALTFVLALAVPLAVTVMGEQPDNTIEENREPAPWPEPPHDLKSLAAWPDAFTRYFADHVAFRSTLVRWQALFRVHVLGTSPSPDVILGRDGWLYYGTDGAIPDYSGADRYDTASLEVWRTTLQHTQDWLASQGIAYVFVIAPDKHTVYPEHLPGGIERVSQTPRAQQVARYLATHSTVNVVDLTEAVTAAKSLGRVYHRTDTHWNELGAFAGYREVIRALPPSLGLRPHDLSDFAITTVPRPGMDLAGMLGLRAVYTEDDVHLDPLFTRRTRVLEPANASRGMMYVRVVTEGDPAAPRAVIFRDSFGSALVPFLSDHFSRAVYVWQNEFDPQLVRREKPAVVIQQWVARHFYTAWPYDAMAEER
ncbi:MAG: hypothetical protein IT178_12795 [Acidobacteria bacterium]|nr:hypothetical protein [Acidobacteriota bacterium]